MPSMQQILRLIEGLPVFNVDEKLDTIINQNSALLEVCYQINRSMQTFIRKDHRNEENTMSQMSDLVAKLQAEVADVKSVKEGFQTVVASLKQQLQDALNNAVSTGDMTALQQAINDIDSNVQELSNAVTANTPAASEPPVTAPVTPVVVDAPADTSSSTPPADTSSSTPATDTSSTPPADTPPADTPTAPAPAAATPADTSTPSTDNSGAAPATDTPQPADANPNTPSNS